MSEKSDSDSLEDRLKDLNISASVGTAEIEARKIMGNDRYEEIVSLNKMAALASIAAEQGNAKRMHSLANVYTAVAGAIQTAALLASVLAIYSMVFWALH